MLCITQLVRRGRLVIMKFVNAYRREHRIKDRELACGESSDHDAPRAEALGGKLHEAHLRGDGAHAREHTTTPSGPRLAL